SQNRNELTSSMNSLFLKQLSLVVAWTIISDSEFLIDAFRVCVVSWACATKCVARKRRESSRIQRPAPQYFGSEKCAPSPRVARDSCRPKTTSCLKSSDC